jgi:valacyclovir hydrolase
VAGIKLHFEEAGSGPPLVLLTSVLGSAQRDFAAQIQHFSRYFRVIAPEFRGYGGSRPPQRDFPDGFYFRDAHDIIDLLDQLHLDSISILGWSDGANTGCILAAQFPGRVRQLVAWGGNSYVSESEVVKFREMRSFETWSPRAVAALESIYGTSLPSLWNAYVDALDRIYASGGNIYRHLLSTIGCPTLILHGDKDPLVPSFHADILHDEIKGSLLQRFPEGKHNIHVRCAEEFNGIVGDFLQGGKY